MESLPKDSLIEFNPETLQDLRKQYDLDKPGRIEEAIHILEEWVKKQNHFVVKSFPRDYLERSIIISKGSVERAKKKLDKICTFRTIFPDFFEIFDVKKSPLLDDLYGVFLPKLTKDHYRVFFLINRAKTFQTGFLDFYRYFFMQCDYIQAYDYCNGIIMVLDYTEANVMETVKWFNLTHLRESITIIREGYGMRIKGIHFVTGSKAIDAIVTIFKQVLSDKIVGRIYVHKTVEEIGEFLDKDIIPVEYGGNGKPLLELQKTNLEILTSKSVIAHISEMRKARTNETLRKMQDNHENQYSGLPGSFRALAVD
ncbi:retinaldehyde-binding protein 1-like [Pararge aegeria]|uniref:retinaldehyde-binding protein 1-like n=1 Tax=Pararge aegeria TaxID=116150 RepID=UPI0019D07129|nr:retinaldehyde-binding protein 1-like [Pararge aegeria]